MKADVSGCRAPLYVGQKGLLRPMYTLGSPAGSGSGFKHGLQAPLSIVSKAHDMDMVAYWDSAR